MKEHQMPYISIVIPVYNVEKYLRECIDSVLSQSFRDFELILVDDGSKDSSGEICDEYLGKDERVRVIHQSNGGVTAARRTGVEAARAEWIMFVDADDKVTIDGLQRLVEVQRKDSDLDIIEGSYLWFYPDGTTKPRPNIALQSKKLVFYNGHDYALSLCREYGAFRGPVAKLIRKIILLKSNAFEIPRWITNREDTMMLMIIAQHIRKHVLVPKVVYLYRQQFGESAITNKLSFDYWSDYLEYTETVVLNGVLPLWDEVWRITVKDVFGIIVHSGNITTGRMPEYFRQNVLPVLNRQIDSLNQADKLYVRLLSLPAIVRYPICVILHVFFIIKRSLLGKYFALQSRK